MAYTRKDYLGTRCDTTLNGGINASTTSVTITSATGWPSVSNAGFYAVIDPDTTSEEKVLVTARTGTGLTVTRGADGTTGVSHSSGATIRPCISATDFDEANYMVAQTVGKVTTAGQLLKASAANTFTALDKGSNSTVLAVDSGGTLGYTTVTNAMVDASAAIAISKLEPIATARVVGNVSGSTAVPSAIATSSLTQYTTVTKAASEAVASSTTLQNDDELFFTTQSGVAYEIDFALVYAVVFPVGDPAVPGFKFSMAEDATTRGEANYVYISDAASVANQDALTFSTSSTSSACKTASTLRCVSGYGFLTGGGGTFRVQWAQNASSTDAVAVAAGSYLRYRAIT